MTKLRVHNLTVSVDGYAAGPDQSLENPMGVGGRHLHGWMFATRMGHALLGKEGGSEGVDQEFAARGDVGVGATIMGRNMFGPIRGSWGDDQWKGWWGETPPYHHPVFVLTHHPHPPIPMHGGTTFHFVTNGIESALDQARAAADGADVRIGGGPSTIQQYLRAGLVDELHVAIVPVLLGRGERLLDDLGSALDGYDVEFTSTPAALHVRITRSS
jgi:dihydrofolate reductase